MSDEYVMTFGKYIGERIDKVPADYLLYLWDNGMWDERRRGAHADPVRQYIIENFHALETECPDRIITHKP